SRATNADAGGEDPFGDVERLLKPVRQSALYDCLSETIQAKSTTARAAPPQQTDSIAARILIAEDNPVNREVAGEALRQLGCLVDSANDGKQAIAAWEAAHYDVVLMDCHMPNMDGIEAAKIVRMREATDGRRRTPILALTANARGEDYERCIAAGMDDYLTKPLTLEELRAALDRWIDRGFVAARPNPDARAKAESTIGSGDAPTAEVTVKEVQSMSGGTAAPRESLGTPMLAPQVQVEKVEVRPETPAAARA